MFSIPPCRVYASELVAYFEQHGWTCDDCKACIVCDESPSESEKSEDLLVRIVLVFRFVLVFFLLASSLLLTSPSSPRCASTATRESTTPASTLSLRKDLR